MRILFTSLIAATFLVIEILDNPQLFQRLVEQARGVFSSAVYDKELRIEGLSALTRSEVEEALPLSRATSWWLTNFPSIQSRLEENPWVKRAVVENCPGVTSVGSWGCFILSITERAPRFLATVDAEEWLIAEDGAFLLPLSNVVGKEGLKDHKKLAVDAREITKVSGLASRLSSPDVLGAQLELVRTVVQLFPNLVGRKVASIELQGGSDFSVRFASVPFPVVFSSSSLGPTISDQAERCGLLLKKFQNKYDEIERVDLAFDKVGVVRLKKED